LSFKNFIILGFRLFIKLENSKNPFLDEADDVEIEETKPNRLKHHLFNKDASFAQLSAERNNKIFEPHPLDSDRVADKKKRLKQKNIKVVHTMNALNMKMTLTALKLMMDQKQIQLF
jgi:hypothetical protein